MKKFYVADAGTHPEWVPPEERANYHEFEAWANQHKEFAVDTETTGLMPYHGDTVFAIVVAGPDDKVFYFDTTGMDTLPGPLERFFKREESIGLAGHNIKFDLHAIYCTFGVRPPARWDILDTVVSSRLGFNDHFSYSLDACIQRMDPTQRKSTAVEEYIKAHNLWEWETIPGKKIRRKKPFFDKVPGDIMFEYACKDAWQAFKLAIHSLDKIKEIDELLPDATVPKLFKVAETEMALLPVVTEMESLGVRIDEEYCVKATEHYQKVMRDAEIQFQHLTAQTYKASPKLFAEVFASDKEKWKYTEKGNPSFESDVLERFESPAAKQVLIIRDAKSRLDFFASFTWYTDAEGFLHPNFNPGGTSTGRFSSSEPNFQNLTNDEENTAEAFPVRRAIIPPDENYCIVSFDYKQQEYRLLLEYAQEQEVIEKVKAGVDVHQATADLMGVSRKEAKTLNFMLLYGGGVQKLADALGISLERAKELKALYFSALPKVKVFIRAAMSTAESRGYIYNWAGRRYFCENPEFSYTMPNRVIQGGGADIIKKAMVEIHKEVLVKSHSTMALTVHDELVFYMHSDDFHFIPKIKEIMEKVFPAKHMPLEVSVEHSWESLADLKKGPPESNKVFPHKESALVNKLVSKHGRSLLPGGSKLMRRRNKILSGIAAGFGLHELHRMAPGLGGAAPGIPGAGAREPLHNKRNKRPPKWEREGFGELAEKIIRSFGVGIDTAKAYYNFRIDYGPKLFGKNILGTETLLANCELGTVMISAKGYGISRYIEAGVSFGKGAEF